MKTNLLQILWKKEIVHWKRLKEMFTKFNGWISKLTFGLIVAILITLSHYGFAFMSTLWSSCLWVVARKRFKINIQRMALTV